MNRRNAIKRAAGMLGLSYSAISGEYMPCNNFYQNVKDNLSNGIDKIFQVRLYQNNIVSFPKPLITGKSNCVEWLDVKIPIRIKDICEINNIAWHTLICASLENKNEDIFNFIKTKTTDVFVEETIYKYFCWMYKEVIDERNINVHKVNIKQYYEYFTKNLNQKFAYYTSNLFIACNMSKQDSALIPVHDFSYGVAILDNSKFMLGQI